MRITDDYILDSKVFAIKRMDIPAGTVLEGAVLQEHAFAVAQADHHRTEESLDFVLVQGRIGIIQAAGSRTRLRIAFVGIPDFAVPAQDAAAGKHGLPLVVGNLALLDFAPEFSAAVDDSAARDRDVRRAFGVDGAEATAHVKPFEVGVYDGIKILVGIEYYDCILADIELDVALQPYGAGAPDAGRNFEAAAAFADEGVDCIAESPGVESFPVGHSSEVGDADAM